MKKNMVLATSLSVMMLAACAANKPSPVDSSSSKADKQAAQAKAKAPTPAPAGSPLAKITTGMADTDVRRILGEPTSSKNYMTGKQFIPMYFGPDTSRMEYIYKGLGRVTLSRNQYSGGLSVIRVDYDPGI